jgi:hypothetical protein
MPDPEDPTVTVVLHDPEPPAPLTSMVYVVVVVGLTVEVPEVAVATPLSVADVASDDVFVSVTEPPDVVDVGLAVIVQVGAGVELTHAPFDTVCPDAHTVTVALQEPDTVPILFHTVMV